jgi:4a-hydroxytetrahydrobiopterin dehydratase
MPAFDDLASRHCRPLKGAEHRLAAEEVAARLAVLPLWALSADGEAIERSFSFADYYRTIAFVNALAYIANREDHHPDLGVHYNKAVVRFSTHDVGGLSENDFICAAKTTALYE